MCNKIFYFISATQCVIRLLMAGKRLWFKLLWLFWRYFWCSYTWWNI